MTKDMSTIQKIIVERGTQGALEYLADEIEELKSAAPKPSSAPQKETKSEDAKGVTRG